MTTSIGLFYEFFAGGGMARAGLGSDWECLFANDFDHKKGKAYRNNWGDDDLKTADVRTVTTKDLPSQSDLAWASFPCQDLSLAGGGAGLKGERSGTFWPFWDLMIDLGKEDRAPKVVVLENVCGTLTSHKGKDFEAICSTLERAGYQFGAVVIDAALFVPQSRPRLFVIGVQQGLDIPEKVKVNSPSSLWHTRALIGAYENLSAKTKKSWVWWDIETPSARKTNFSDLIEEDPECVPWHSAVETRKLLSMMSEVNLNKVKQAKRAGKKMVGAIYKRTRMDENRCKVQRAEVRFDDVAGCLRTPAGGSSRQLIMIVEGRKVRSRLISSRETARLMGLPDDYQLPDNYNESYHLMGDGVVVPVVRHLASNIIEAVLHHQNNKSREAA
ncbi:DNA cytosine methyltransferase [Candidatus Vondammii sp. HM_W22]|uniref:DNA cytosine methyltransferase n=1 Tax=Candidatus Vondammii sp. HM_W22 TaxID=2687299 RepID=UPI002F2F1D82